MQLPGFKIPESHVGSSGVYHRKEWTTVAVEDVPPGQNSRQAGQQWLKPKQKFHKTLAASSNQKRFTFVARRKSVWAVPNNIVSVGRKRIKHNYLWKNLALALTRRIAKFGRGTMLKGMKRDDVSKDMRPSVQQIKNYRRKLSSVSKLETFSVECLGELRALVSWLPCICRPKI